MLNERLVHILVFPKRENGICSRYGNMICRTMRIVSRRTLFEYWAKHPETKTSLQHWLGVAKATNWPSMQAVVKTFPKAKKLNGERARFEVAGGNYRMIVAFNFKRAVAFIKFVGTHKEYDKVDALKVSRY